MKDISIIIGGEAGYGVESLSKVLSLFFTREGYSIFTNSEYENRIRGGHAYTFIRIGESNVRGYKSSGVDILFVMDKVGIEKHQGKVRKDGIVIYDSSKIREIGEYRNDLRYLPVQMQKISSSIVGMPLTRNVVGAGAILGALDYKTDGFKDSLAEIFKKKGDEIIKKNHQALDLGFEAVKEKGEKIHFDFKGKKGKKMFMMHGNEAIVLGSIKAGVKYLSAYPMTPGSSVMTTMAKEAKNYNILVSHVEDEIAAISNVIGAGYAGIRSMTSTSGGGFALMGEALGLSGMIEAPCVVINAQRPGPSTGLPTMTAQGDLLMAIYSGQGDFPKLILAPGDHEECIRLSFESFNYAEKFQIPVILLTEKYLADSYKSLDFVDFDDGTWKIERGEIEGDIESQEDYKRFKFTDSGVSPRAIVGTTNGAHTVTSYEHNQFGKAEEGEKEVVEMMEKRQKKLESLKKVLPMPVLYGDENCDITFVGWGATKGILLEVVDLLKEKGVNAALIHFQYIFPFKDEIEDLLKKQKKLISVETNITGQFARLVTQNTGVKMHQEIKVVTGKQITAKQVLDEI